MEIAEIIAIIVSLMIVGCAVLYIVRAKKKGARCIGCPHGASCPSAKNGQCSCQKNPDT